MEVQLRKFLNYTFLDVTNYGVHGSLLIGYGEPIR